MVAYYIIICYINKVIAVDVFGLYLNILDASNMFFYVHLTIKFMAYLR